MAGCTFFRKSHRFDGIPMSKRTATEIELSAGNGEPFSKASGSGQRRENVTVDEMGEFEDAWEDEIESDEDAIDAEAQGEDGALEVT